MCLTPILIPNPHYKGGGHVPHLEEKYKADRGVIFSTKDTDNSKIYVPCGKCPQCVAYRQSNYAQRVEMESLQNHIFFITLTYNEESIPKIKTSTGYVFRYADFRDLRNMFKRIRKVNALTRPFKYIAINELGSKGGRPHFHLLILLPILPDDTKITIVNLESHLFNTILSYWSKNVGTNRKPIYKPCCTYIRKFIHGKLNTTYECHYVDERNSANGLVDVSYYLSKYLLKGLENDKDNPNFYLKFKRKIELTYNEDEAKKLIKLIKPRIVKSLNFGEPFSPFIYPKLRSFIESSYGEPFWSYQYQNGKKSPLCRYYRNKLVKVSDVERSCQIKKNVGWFEMGEKLFDYSSTSPDVRIVEEKLRRYAKICKEVELRDSSLNNIY